MNKDQEIVEQARKYVDAIRYFEDASRYADSIRWLGVQRLASAESQEERERISEEQRQNILRSLAEGQKRISAPINKLNELVQNLDGPVYFEHAGQELMVVPRDETLHSYLRCDIRPKDRGSETSL